MPTDGSTYAGGPVAADAPSFEIVHESEPGETLLAGFTEFGLAGLTAVDYLVDALDLERTGHVAAESLPTVTPFEDGVPRHPTRFFSRDDLDVTVLVGELFVPRFAVEPFGDAVLDWIDAHGVREVAVLSGVPVAHGPDDHRTYYVATDDYRPRLDGHDVPPMGTGFLDGVDAALIERGIDADLAAAVYLTPVHARAPDVEAAIRLLDAVSEVYNLGVDPAPLQEYAAQVESYYRGLADRVEAVADEQTPDDRMYV